MLAQPFPTTRCSLPAARLRLLQFRGRSPPRTTDTDHVRALLKEVEEGEVQRLVFAVPWGSVWALPAYELALLTAARLKAYQTRNVELMLVTPEDAPLQLFGRSASDAVRELLGDADVTLITGTCPIAAYDGRLRTVPEQSIAADRVLALPRLQGHSIHGVPQTVEGFVPVDQHGRVVGLDNVFAAGDITTFPVKQGGIATQQAFVRRRRSPRWPGSRLRRDPSHPCYVGCCFKSHPLFMRRNMSGADEPDWVSETPIWWPPTKIVGRQLTPFLAALAGEKVTREEPPPTNTLAVEVDLQAQDLERLTTVRFEPQAAELPRADPARLEANRPATVLDVVHTDPLVVAPEDTLADAAPRCTSSASTRRWS